MIRRIKRIKQGITTRKAVQDATGVCRDGIDKFFTRYGLKENFREKDLYNAFKKAVARASNILKFVPVQMLTVELCEIAVTTDGYALQFVPPQMQTFELCQKAVTQNGLALRYVPKHLITAEMCRKAVEHCALALQYVPEPLRTAELCQKAIEQNTFRRTDGNLT